MVTQTFKIFNPGYLAPVLPRRKDISRVSIPQWRRGFRTVEDSMIARICAAARSSVKQRGLFEKLRSAT